MYIFVLKDAKISEAEWFKMWGNCLEQVAKDEFPLWQKKYMDLMFDVNDKSGISFICDFIKLKKKPS
jgi:hypothetical protein